MVEIPPMDNPTQRMGGVAVVANDTWTALNASKLVDILVGF